MSYTSASTSKPSDSFPGLMAIVAGGSPKLSPRQGSSGTAASILRLGGRVLGFNIDTGFANSLDCPILVDLRKTDPRLLRKYMSESAWAGFQQKYRARAPRNGDGGQAA